MRWGRAVAVAIVFVALTACGGGGKKSNATATGAASTGSQVSAGSGSPAATDSGSSTSDQAGGGDSPVVSADSGSGDQPAGQQQPNNTDAPVPPGLKPFAGKYAYHATGTSSLNGSASNVDAEVDAIVEDLSDTDQRTTTTGGGGAGDQVQVLRYSSDKVELESLEMKGAVHKIFNGPVVYAPLPGSIGQTWAWDLTSTDALTHVHQSSRYDRTETLTIGGQSVDTVVVETDLSFTGDINGSGHLTSWVSPAYKMSIRNHSTLDATYGTFHFTNDITADLLDLRPS